MAPDIREIIIVAARREVDIQLIAERQHLPGRADLEQLFFNGRCPATLASGPDQGAPAGPRARRPIRAAVMRADGQARRAGGPPGPRPEGWPDGGRISSQLGSDRVRRDHGLVAAAYGPRRVSRRRPATGGRVVRGMRPDRRATGRTDVQATWPRDPRAVDRSAVRLRGCASWASTQPRPALAPPEVRVVRAAARRLGITLLGRCRLSTRPTARSIRPTTTRGFRVRRPDRGRRFGSFWLSSGTSAARRASTPGLGDALLGLRPASVSRPGQGRSAQHDRVLPMAIVDVVGRVVPPEAVPRPSSPHGAASRTPRWSLVGRHDGAFCAELAGN